jgi:hypothetical protein
VFGSADEPALALPKAPSPDESAVAVRWRHQSAPAFPLELVHLPYEEQTVSLVAHSLALGAFSRWQPNLAGAGTASRPLAGVRALVRFLMTWWSTDMTTLPFKDNVFELTFEKAESGL